MNVGIRHRWFQVLVILSMSVFLPAFGYESESDPVVDAVEQSSPPLPAAFEIRLYTALHKENPAAPGDKRLRNREGTWTPIFTWSGAQPIRQIRAHVDIGLVEGIPAIPRSGTTDAETGIYSTSRLVDGTYWVAVHPFYDSELSKRAARGDASGDHHLGADVHPFPANGNFELEYRPLLLEVEVEDFTIVDVRFAKAPSRSRPPHAVLFWKQIEGSQGKQVLEIDWKPDFVRRIRGGVRPRHFVRGSPVDVVMLHHTAGTSIGSALFAFTNENSRSGAHFLIDLDGHVIRLADDRYQINHGEGARQTRRPAWRNQLGLGINKRAIGIELVHEDQHGLDAATFELPSHYTSAQYAALVDLVRSLIEAHSIPLNNVIGHQDAVAKAACPGRHVDWPYLEAAGVALAPRELSRTQLDAMYGGFFVGRGTERTLGFGYREVERSDGTFAVLNAKGKVVAEGLSEPPIQGLRQSLRSVGYNVDSWIVVDDVKVHPRDPSVFEETLAYALSQFIRHYCTESRLRPDLRMAYRDSPRVWRGLFVDHSLAKLLRGAEVAADGS
jgi:N-acetyl-anhydromuramyl-L-alanine amidase AmpD